VSRGTRGDGPLENHPAQHSEGCRPPIPKGLGNVAGFTSESLAGLGRDTQWDATLCAVCASDAAAISRASRTAEPLDWYCTS
jgi:hypothetical protein